MPQGDHGQDAHEREWRERAERAEAERERLRRELERVERERDRLRRENDQLKKELDLARRAAKRQAAPFSKNRPVPHPRRPGRKPGTAYGTRARRPAPPHIDEQYDAPLPPTCPACAGAMIETGVATQYHEDLPPVRPLVRVFHVHVGTCQQCGRRVQSRHPLQTSDALGAAAAQLGPQVVATAAHLHKECGLPLGKIARFYQQHFGLTVTPGGLVQALHRAARQAAPTCTALLDTVRQSAVVTPDETGWRVGAELQWLWVAATPSTTVYAIAPGRGFDEAAALLSADFAGTLVRDGWAPYRQFERAAHQTCLQHLLRRARDLQTDHPRAPVPSQVRDVLQQALALRDRHAAGAVSDHGLAVARNTRNRPRSWRDIGGCGTMLPRPASEVVPAASTSSHRWRCRSKAARRYNRDMTVGEDTANAFPFQARATDHSGGMKCSPFSQEGSENSPPESVLQDCVEPIRNAHSSLHR